jgi:hypothetical protein
MKEPKKVFEWGKLIREMNKLTIPFHLLKFALMAVPIPTDKPLRLEKTHSLNIFVQYAQ